jgi:hypothetical protein
LATYDGGMVKTALAAICFFTLSATVYLSASLLILQPPRANYQQWALVASAIIVQGALTLVAMRAGSPRGLRYAAAAGGAAIAALGASSIDSTVSGPHFEGYALVLGSMLVVQGLLTLITFAGFPAGAAAQRRH